MSRGYVDLPQAEFDETIADWPRDKAVAVIAAREVERDRLYFPTARPKQIPPPGDWFVWVILAGRGFGKTKTGSEWSAEVARVDPGDYAICAPTIASARDVCVENPTSGLLAVLRRRGIEIEVWNRSLGEVVLVNGSRFKLLSAEEPDRARGWNFKGAWCDELGAWRYDATWYEALIPAVRIGDQPRVLVTTTPRPTALIRDLVGRHDGSVVVTRGSTWENADNLSPGALEELRIRYAGTRLGRQELEGELLDDIEGALWQRSWIDSARVAEVDHRELFQIAVAIDPGHVNDETGIVACGRTHERYCPACGPVESPHGFVLADRTCGTTADAWAREAIALYDEVEANYVAAEINGAYDMVRFTLRTVRPGLPYRKVHATRGKELRADPVSALYEQGRIHHVGSLPELEDQLCAWVPGEGASPDRLDALVWAMTSLDLGRSEQAHTSARRAARSQLPAVRIGVR